MFKLMARRFYRRQIKSNGGSAAKLNLNLETSLLNIESLKKLSPFSFSFVTL